MIEKKYIVKNLEQWILRSEAMKEGAEKRLIEYAELPVKKFSNAASEKAWGYVRVPPPASIDYLGLWHASYGAIKLLQDEDAFGDALGRSAGYLLLGFHVQLAAYEKSFVQRCFLDRSQVAKVFFMLASFCEFEELEKMSRKIVGLVEGKSLDENGSKLALFCISLAKVVAGFSIDHAAREFDALPEGFVDTTGALSAYKDMVLALKEPGNLEYFEDLVEKSLEMHVKESNAAEGEAEFYDFSYEAWAVLPYEVVGYVNMVHHLLGLKVRYPDSDLGNVCKKISQGDIHLISDEITWKVKARVNQVLMN